jgi:predicted MFS family arabinose efflux permease
MVMLFTFQALTAFLPTYLVTTKGVSPASAAGPYALLFVSGSAFQPIAGSAADRFGDREVSAFVAGASVLPLVGVVLVEGPLALAVLIALIGARLGTDPILNAYVVRALPPGIQGTAWGLLRTVFFTVASTGSIVVGALGDAGWFDEAFFLLAALTVFAALLCAGLPSRSALA